MNGRMDDVCMYGLARMKLFLFLITTAVLKQRAQAQLPAEQTAVMNLVL